MANTLPDLKSGYDPNKDPAQIIADAAAKINEQERRNKAYKQAEATVNDCKLRIVLGREDDAVFFASLLGRMRTVFSWSVDTACTDGKQIIYNPDFVNGLDASKVRFLMVHEVMHCALHHHTRRGSRDPYGWNLACDAAINYILKGAGYDVPDDCIMPGRAPFENEPEGLTAEEYYNRLPTSKRQKPGSDDGNGGGNQDGQGSGQGQGNGQPGDYGQVADAGSDPSTISEAEADWDVAVKSARRASKMRGNGDGGVAEAVEAANETKVDWRELLRQFVSNTARNEYSWMKPNRRFLASGIYLPGLSGDEIGHVAIVIDTSGSIGAETVAKFLAECQAALHAYECSAKVYLHNYNCYHSEEWEPSLEHLDVSDKIRSGGTSHHDVMEKINSGHEQPVCCIGFSDLISSFPDEPPYPVMWVTPPGSSNEPPWGVVVESDL